MMDSEIDPRLGGLKVEPDLQPLQDVAPNHGGVSQLQYPQQGVGKKDVKSKRKVAIKQENGGRKRTPMPAYIERKEFGLAQILMSESELSFVRPFYKYIPRMPFVKYADFTAQTVVRITERELGNLNVYRHAHGEQKITLNRNQAFMDAMPAAGRRYEEYMAREIVKKDARLHYHDVLRVIREHALDVDELSQVLEL
ncbi:uncharacterized protein PAC_14136 [Phialocephala subalpina]|uniref:Uncharacterized protein n=1 Tax=Phialocephala subalpina TaxID=576137 RepID=A0A1L7XGU8_9HELO|nr:uncharacterized protein PAC_14136 [Phialocephala subalpina]